MHSNCALFIFSDGERERVGQKEEEKCIQGISEEKRDQEKKRPRDPPIPLETSTPHLPPRPSPLLLSYDTRGISKRR